MKPKPDTPEWSAYSAGMRAQRNGQTLHDNPIRSRSRVAGADQLRDWWSAGWREAQRLAAEEQSP